MSAMNTYLVVKTLHIVSATIVFGTGIGIANFMFPTPDPSHKGEGRCPWQRRTLT
jgi:uncharacterized membrane protein